MAIKKITLTEDHLRLISNIKFEKFTVSQGTATERFAWGIDQWNLFGGTFVLEDVSIILLTKSRTNSFANNKVEYRVQNPKYKRLQTTRLKSPSEKSKLLPKTNLNPLRVRSLPKPRSLRQRRNLFLQQKIQM